MINGMTPELTEMLIYDNAEYLKEAEKNLLRLLQCTKDIKISSVQDLRKEVIRFFNSTEKYISQIEIDNMQLHFEYVKLAQGWQQELNYKKEILLSGDKPLDFTGIEIKSINTFLHADQ